jgi:hypothetical protein
MQVGPATTTQARIGGRRLAPVYRIGLICVFLMSLFAGGRWLVSYWSEGPYATDLRIFLTPVELLRTGHASEIYKFAVEKAEQSRLFPDTEKTGYLSYNHLAYELLMYWPLAKLSYRTALMVWGAINVGLILLIAWLLNPFTKALREFSGVPLLLWMFAFYPLLHTLSEGQDSVVTLLLVALALRLMEDKREFLSGSALGLALFKVHLALGIAFLVFFVPRKWRGLAGFAASAAFVTGISIAMVGPSFVNDYLHIIREQETMTPWGFIPRFMPNFRGLFEWLLVGSLDVGSVLPIIFLFSLATVGATWLVLRVRNAIRPAVLYAAAVPAVLLVSYHLHLQDLTLALLPMVVLLDSCLKGELPRGSALILMLSIAVFYLFGAVSAVTPYLLLHAALLAIPLLLLWVASLGNVMGRKDRSAGVLVPEKS